MKLITNSQKYYYTRLRTRIVTRFWNQQFKSFLHLRRLTEARSPAPPGVREKKNSDARLRQNLLSPCGDLVLKNNYAGESLWQSYGSCDLHYLILLVLVAHLRFHMFPTYSKLQQELLIL